MPTDDRPVHFLGDDLLPPHEWTPDGTGLHLTPVLANITCPDCIDFLAHC